MRCGLRWTAAVIGVVLLGGGPSPARAQLRTAAPAGLAFLDAGRAATSSSGSIEGSVWDDRGRPFPGVVLTVIGLTTTFAVTDDRGRYEIADLTPGAYVIRAVARGFAPQSQRVVVRPQGRSSSQLAMSRAGSPTLLVAGLGVVSAEAATLALEASAHDDADARADSGATPTGSRDESATAWRIRHGRRSILKDSSFPADLLRDDEDDDHAGVVDIVGRAVSAPARAATSFLADSPISGQLNLLTTSVFESPQQLLSGSSNVARGTAYVRLGAPAGDSADWMVRGAVTEADIASWAVAGNYRTRGEGRHQYHVGLSYSTQTYGGGHPLALREFADGSRNVGELFGFDTFTLSPRFKLNYGARYAHYDYLARRGLVSPSLGATLIPSDGVRVNLTVSSRADAPGADEFSQPGDEGIWLPPQRTFSSLVPGTPFRSTRTTQVAGEVERDFGRSTVSVRAFRQEVENQLMTVFGADVPNYDSVKLGHYFVGAAGSSQATGGSVALRSTLARHVQASVAYSLAAAQLLLDQRPYILLLAPSTARPMRERLHDVTTSIDAELPETSTKILVLYRLGNGYFRAFPAGGPNEPATGLDSRFDVQVRQSLPFLNFNNARWEMLIAVRNFLRDIELDQSIYDELLAVRPPKRLVGGVTLHF
jgi:hypothetical protein